MGDKYLSEVIDFERDIEPYQIIRIYSGVGSGKNHWVETLAKKGFNILLITSRKATADAQAKKMEGTRWIDLEELSEDSLTNERSKRVVVTNAGIEKFVKHKYDPNDEKTHIWRYFDFIILDEAHSVVADATFTDSPFHVTFFLRWVREHDQRCKIIFMTGTPDSIEWMFGEKLKEQPTFHSLDLYDQCRHIDPEKVILSYKYKIEKVLKDYVQRENRRIIYFANSITRMETMVAELQAQGFPVENIGIAYSGEERRKFPEVLLDKKEENRRYLLENEKLPPEIKLFLTTNQNKEGININDDDIKIMFSESCERSSLIQMAGRVRKGLDWLVILYDSVQHSPKTTPLEIDIDYECVKPVNVAWQNYYGKNDDENDNDARQKDIEFVERKFPNIRYNYFTNKFQFYEAREKGLAQADLDLKFIRDCVNSWFNETYCILEEDGSFQKTSGSDQFQKWFPYSSVFLEEEATRKEQLDHLRDTVRTFFEENSYLNRSLTKDEKGEMWERLKSKLSEINYDWKRMKISEPRKQINPFLNKTGFKIAEVRGQRKGNCFQITEIDVEGEI